MTEILRPEDHSRLPPVESHRRQTARVLAALGLTLLGFALPIPYAGYTFSLVWFVPAAILEVVAISPAADRGSRVLGLILLVPTAVGIVLAVLGAFDSARRLGGNAPHLLPLLGVTIVFSLAAAIAGRRRSPR